MELARRTRPDVILMDIRMPELSGIELADRLNKRKQPVPSIIFVTAHDRDDSEVPWQDGAIIARAWPDAVFSSTGGLGHRRILRDPSVIRAVATFVAVTFVPGTTAPCGSVTTPRSVAAPGCCA